MPAKPRCPQHLTVRQALIARANDRTTVIHVRVNPQGRFGGAGAWWDVVAETPQLESTVQARAAYEQAADRRYYV